MIHALIVDDERPAREELAWLLEQTGEPVEVVAQAASAAAALEALDEHPVDLVFLDINMPGIDGVRLAELWQDRSPHTRPLVIFATAYEHHAVDAFEVDAVDYLLKPLRLERLRRALRKAAERLERRAAARAAAPPRTLDRISVEERGEYRVIPVDEILFFESEDGIVVVQTSRGERFITDFSLKFLEQSLDERAFFRSHRSYIVRLDAISSIAPWGAGTYRLMLDREADLGVPLARSRAGELKALIPWSAAIFDSP